MAAVLLAPLVLGIASVAHAEPPPDEGSWEFSVTPYIWIPAMTGSATAKGVKIDIDTSISDVFTESDFAFALQVEGEAWHRSRWGLLFNGQWSILKVNNNLKGTPAEFDLTMNMGLFELAGAYSFGRQALTSRRDGPPWQVQPFVGVRVTVMRLKFDFDAGGSNDPLEAWAEPFLGARGAVRFGADDRWRAWVRGDVGGFGAGGSDFSWNVVGGFGYDFHIRSTPSMIALGARALSQDYSNGSGANKFRWDVTQYGPFIALQLRF